MLFALVYVQRIQKSCLASTGMNSSESSVADPSSVHEMLRAPV